MLRAVLRGKRIDFGLGPLRSVSLSDAREAAFQYRRKIFAGLDPRVEMSKKDLGILTFAEAAVQTHQELVANTGKNGKHKDQWINTLRTYAFPHIGHLNVDDIHARHVIAALKPIWNKKQVTARRVRQRIGVTLDWSTAHGYRTGDNPAGAISAGLAKQKSNAKHFAAMRHDDVPFLFEELEHQKTVGADALKFTILTALRSGTVRHLRWDHINACEERPNHIPRKAINVVNDDNAGFLLRFQIRQQGNHGGTISITARFVVTEDLKHLIALITGVFTTTAFLRCQPVTLLQLSDARNAGVNDGVLFCFH